VFHVRLVCVLCVLCVYGPSACNKTDDDDDDDRPTWVNVTCEYKLLLVKVFMFRGARDVTGIAHRLNTPATSHGMMVTVVDFVEK